MIENRKFEKINHLPIEEYDDCVFAKSHFSNADLTGISFNECIFDDCDLSLVNVTNVLLNDIKFLNCKLLGVRFDTCNKFGLSVHFENCQMSYSTFYKLKLKKVVFKNCDLQETDFTETDLSGANFDACNLERAIFINSNLEKADFSSALKYSIDPEKNRMKMARFSIPSVIGLLDKYNIEIV